MYDKMVRYKEKYLLWTVYMKEIIQFDRSDDGAAVLIKGKGPDNLLVQYPRSQAADTGRKLTGFQYVKTLDDGRDPEEELSLEITPEVGAVLHAYGKEIELRLKDLVALPSGYGYMALPDFLQSDNCTCDGENFDKLLSAYCSHLEEILFYVDMVCYQCFDIDLIQLAAYTFPHFPRESMHRHFKKRILHKDNSSYSRAKGVLYSRGRDQSATYRC